MTAGSEYETSLETRAAQELKTAFNRVTTAEQELKEEHHLAPSVLFRSLDLSQYTHTHTPILRVLQMQGRRSTTFGVREALVRQLLNSSHQAPKSERARNRRRL